MYRTPTLLAMLVLLPGIAAAAPCDRLDEAQRKLASTLLASTYPYECCDESLDKCLKQPKVCKLAKRLRDAICTLVKRGKDEKTIKNALDRRARSMSALGKPAAIDLAGQVPAGVPESKVTVVVYACARCPFCSKVVPDLHTQVTSGPLKGKVKLYFRPFPIRGHAGSAEGGMAMLAAQKMGQLWPYLLKLYGQFDQFAVAKLATWASELGLDPAAFEAAMADKDNRALLVQSKKEGLRLGVKATPTLFINGRMYVGDLDHDTLVDVLDEEADRVAGQAFCDGKKGREYPF